MSNSFSKNSQDADRTDPSALGWLLVITAIAAAARFYGLEQQLWYDEITTLLDSVRKPLGEIVTTYESQNQHTLYSALARISVVTLGESNATLRLPAVLFGIAGVPALYWFARHIADRTESLLAAALLAVSYHHVWFSQNARGYTMMLLWTLLATGLFLRGVRQPSLGIWTGYGAVLALGMYTHLTMAFVAAGHGLVWLWMLADMRHAPPDFTARRWLPLAGFGTAGALTLLLYAPVLPQLFARTVGGAVNVESEWTNPLWLAMETLRGLFGPGVGAFGVAATLLFALMFSVSMLITLRSFGQASLHALALMIFPGVVTAVVMLGLGHNLWPRFFFFGIGFALLVLARALVRGANLFAVLLAWTDESRRRAVLFGAVCLIYTFFLLMRPAFLFPKQDFAGAMNFLDAQRAPGQPVFTAGLATLPYQRYYRRDWPAAETAAQLQEFRAAGKTAWVVYAMPIYIRSRQPEIWNAIESEFTTVEVFRGTLGGGEVYVARTKP